MSHDHPDHRRQLRPGRRDGPPVRRAAATTSRCARGVPTGSRSCATEILAAAPRTSGSRSGRSTSTTTTRSSRSSARSATTSARIDRVVVNAGLGKGAPLGTGRFDANRETAMTNFVAALAQTEAAMEIFRDAGRRPPRDDLVDVGACAGCRGTSRRTPRPRPRVAHLAEGVRDELLRHADQGDRALPRLHRARR